MNKKKFESLPKKKQARMLAHDVIKHVITKENVRATIGTYISPESTNGICYFSSLVSSGETCQVCAKGALIYSYLSAKQKDISLYDYEFSKNTDMQDLFGIDYHKMEFIFENGRYWKGGVCDPSEKDHVVSLKSIKNFNKFCEDLPGDCQKNRIEQIMRNFLFNDKIDLSNHPSSSEEIFSEDKSGDVVICKTKEPLNFS